MHVLFGTIDELPKMDSVTTTLRGMIPYLVVDPLVEAGQLSWFAASSLQVHGHELSIMFDADGAHYGGDAGLALWIDGLLAAHSPILRRLVLPLQTR